MGSKKHKKHKSENKAGTDTDEGGQEKPLKLVLKVGGGQGSGQELHQDAVSPPQQEERSRHKHKKKKKKKSYDRDRERTKDGEHHAHKRPHEGDDSNEEDEEEDEEVHRKPTTDNDESDGNSSPSRKLREPRTCTLRDSDGVILKQMLNYLVKNLQNKDVNGFFAFPVTDTIAPGYSSIILNPMDFSTMTAKIEAGEYSNVMEFKKDFILMCNNAMTYNRPETIYYKEAKRLLHLGIRQLSKEKLLHLKKTQSFLSSITLQELGFDETGQVIIEQVSATQVKTENQPRAVEEPTPSIRPERDIDRFDAIPDDDLSPEEILSQAQDASQAAKNALTARKPKTDLGFLRLEDDGTTSMTILNPWNDGVVSSTQKVISLGDYMGKLKSGSGSLFRFKEDKRNKVCPETYLCYGPFSSHAPSYDSSFASCTKEESNLLLHTYGGEIGVQYAKSVQKFVENAGISAVEMVDKLLDTLTSGQHSKSKVMLEEQKRKEAEAAEQALQDEMIAKAQKVEEEAAKKENKESKDPVQQSLNQTAAMLSDLYDTQNRRLSQDPPPHLGMIAQPSDKETDLAKKVTNSLVSLAKQVHPQDVVSASAVRGAMGISTAQQVWQQQQKQQQQRQQQQQQQKGSGGGQATATKGGNMSDDSEDDGDDNDEESEEEEEDEEEEVDKQEAVAVDTGSTTSNIAEVVGQKEEEEKDEVDGAEEDEEEEEESEEEDMEEG